MSSPSSILNRNNSYSTVLHSIGDMMPLAAAVIPWGVLCGSLAIQVGLTPIQSQMMSLIVFAGAAQLAGVSLVGVYSPLTSILSSTFIISSRHLLYSAYFQDHARKLPWIKRVFLAFFLTDEMFAVTCSYIEKNKRFDFLYALSSGIVFYITWNLSTLLGIIAGENIDNIEKLGLEFAIAATFIAIVIPQIKNRSTLISVIVSAVVVISLDIYEIQNSLLIATLIGMLSGYMAYGEDKYSNVQ